VIGDQSECADQQSGRSVAAVDEFSAEFNRGVREVTFGMNAASDAPARFQHCDRMARIVQIAGGG
jgi:hypothetical protein